MGRTYLGSELSDSAILQKDSGTINHTHTHTHTPNKLHAEQW